MCILLVEDEFLIREIAKEVLEEAGHEVVDAEHGQQAVDHVDLSSGRFVCLVTDYHMPRSLNGGHVIEHTRAAYPEIPIVLSSAYPHVTSHEWREKHKVHLLVKPYFPSALVALVGRLLA